MRIYRMGRWVALEIADRIFLFDKNGRQDDKSGAPMTFGWARQAGVWDSLFAFPDDPMEPELADDVAVYAGLFQADTFGCGCLWPTPDGGGLSAPARPSQARR